MRARDRQFRAVFDGALDALLIADDQGRYVDGNDAALALIGVTRAQLLTMGVADVTPPESWAAARRGWDAFLRDGRMEGEYRLRRSDGAERIVEFRATARVMPGRHLSVLRDVTERKLGEGQRVRLAAMVESAADAIEGLTLDGTIEYWSPAAERTYGYSAEEALGRSKRIVVPDDKIEEFEELFARVRAGESIRDYETTRRRKDATVFEASVTFSPVLQDGRIVAVSTITRDISEKRALEAHLAVSDRMASVGTLAAGVAHEINNPLTAVIANLDLVAQALAAALPRAPAGSRREDCATPEDHRDQPDASTSPTHLVCLYESGPALARVVADHLMAGLAAGEPLLVVATRAHTDLIAESLRARGVRLDELRARGQAAVFEADETLSLLTVDGTPSRERFEERVGGGIQRLVAQTGAPRVRVYGEMVDLLIRRGHAAQAIRLEEMWNDLGRAQRFSLLCAYDGAALRTPEQVRQVCSSHGAVLVADETLERRDRPAWNWAHTRELARAMAEPDGFIGFGAAACVSNGMEELSEALEDARSSAHRIRHIVRDLKLFSKPDEERRGPVDLRRVLESTLRMAWNEIRHRARLVRDYGEVTPVLGNEARLGQVFLNLVVNAAQAIREGDADRHEIRVRTRTSDDGRVVTDIRDTGAGIAPEALARLFEPFFTTKPVGIGTGLGLSICRRIVHEHGGTITVESTVGRGTTFRVILPAATAQEMAPAPARSTARPARRGRVLVVDDEPLVARAVRRALDPDHEVTAVTSGARALELLEAGEQYDVIICDMMMPQMSGMVLHDVLSKTMPEAAARVVFLTGGVFTAAAREFLDRVPNQRVEKPFDPIHLRGLIDDRVGAIKPGTT